MSRDCIARNTANPEKHRKDVKEIVLQKIASAERHKSEDEGKWLPVLGNLNRWLERLETTH